MCSSRARSNKNPTGGRSTIATGREKLLRLCIGYPVSVSSWLQAFGPRLKSFFSSTFYVLAEGRRDQRPNEQEDHKNIQDPDRGQIPMTVRVAEPLPKSSMVGQGPVKLPRPQIGAKGMQEGRTPQEQYEGRNHGCEEHRRVPSVHKRCDFAPGASHLCLRRPTRRLISSCRSSISHRNKNASYSPRVAGRGIDLARAAKPPGRAAGK